MNDVDEQTLPTDYTCPLCAWKTRQVFGIRLVMAITEHDRVEHDIPAGSATEPPC